MVLESGGTLGHLVYKSSANLFDSLVECFSLLLPTSPIFQKILLSRGIHHTTTCHVKFTRHERIVCLRAKEVSCIACNVQGGSPAQLAAHHLEEKAIEGLVSSPFAPGWQQCPMFLHKLFCCLNGHGLNCESQPIAALGQFHLKE